MNKYKVLLTRDVTESVSYDVIAKSTEDAIVKAKEALFDDPNPNWAVDDYVGDPFQNLQVTSCQVLEMGLKPGTPE